MIRKGKLFADSAHGNTTWMLLLCTLLLVALAATSEVAAKQEKQPKRGGRRLPAKEYALGKRADLRVSALRLAEDGHVEYEVQNRGRTTARNFVVDIYLGTKRWDTRPHSALGPGKKQTVKSTLARVEDLCKGMWGRAVVDSQDVVRENNEKDNERRVYLRRCPDLAVDLEFHDWTDDDNRQHRDLKIRVVNQGRAPAPPAMNEYQYSVSSTGSSEEPLSVAPSRFKTPALSAGASISRWSVGFQRPEVFETIVRLRVTLDVGNKVPESNEKNNDVRATITIGSKPVKDRVVIR